MAEQSKTSMKGEASDMVEQCDIRMGVVISNVGVL